MARDNTDTIPAAEIRVVHRDWRIEGGTRPLNLDWTRKDKMRDLVAVQVGGTRLALEYEDVPAWPDEQFADVWCIRREAGEWVCRFVTTLTRAGERRIGSDPSGKPLMQHLLPNEAPTLPASLEEAGWLISKPGTRSANRIYPTPQRNVDPPPPEPPPEPPPPPPDATPGMRWPCFADGHAPIVAMSPTLQMPLEVWREWLGRYDATVLLDTDPSITFGGFDGTHSPLQAVTVGDDHPVFELARRDGELGRVFAGWFFGDKQRGTALETPAQRLEYARRLILQFAPIPGWKILGFSYDAFEFAGETEVADFIAFCRDVVPDDADAEFMFGARSTAGRVKYAGEYVAWDDHIDEIGDAVRVVREALARDRGRPAWNTERWREQDDGAGKHFRQSEFASLINVLRDHNFGGVIGLAGRGVLSDMGSGAPDPRYRDELLVSLRRGLTPPPPPPPPELAPPPAIESLEWGLIADLDQAWKSDIVKRELPSMQWIRTQATRTRTGGNVEVASRDFVGRPIDAGFNVMVGVYDGPQELQQTQPHHWQGYVLELGRALIAQRRRVWFIADIEAGNPAILPGGVAQYIDLWAGSVGVVEQLRSMGHLVVGPGLVHGNTDGLRRILEAVKFDAVSCHFYPDRGDEALRTWLRDAEEIARGFGYSYGVAGEAGAHGAPYSFACTWNGDEQQIRRARSLRGEFSTRPFWRLKLWYQILDDPNRPDKRYPDFGLFTYGPGAEEYSPKPVAAVFR